MTVAGLIRLLSGFDQSLPVCVADWYECYAHPCEEEASHVHERACLYRATGSKPSELLKGKCVVIGRGRES